MNVPDELLYSSDHEWLKSEEGNRVRIGITDYAQDALGDVVFVELPEVGATVESGGAMSEVESTKSVSDVYAPVTGTVVESNTELADSPEKLNQDPYGEAWICVVELAEGVVLEGFLDAAAYRDLTEG